MDEDETDEFITVQPRRHDRWSVLISGLNWASKVAQVTTNSITDAMIMACEHANQVNIDKKFKEIVNG